MAEHVRRSRELAVTAGLAMALIVGTASCGNDGSGDLPPPASPDGEPAATTPAETLDPQDAKAWEEIQILFDGFMEAWIKWAAKGSPGGFEDPSTTELGEYAYEALLDDASGELIREARDGHVRTGRPAWSGARLLELDWNRTVQDREVPEAVFEVCVDDSDWVVVNADTGEAAASQPDGPNIWTVIAWWAEEREFAPDGWALAERDVDRSRSC